MKKKVLISSFDLAIGGVERSLIGLLSQFDYSKYDVDLMLYKHEGEFFPMIPKGPNLLPEQADYATFRKSIKEIAKEKRYPILLSRVMAKYLSSFQGRVRKIEEPGYLTIQYGWDLTAPFLPKAEKKYDAAISFLWPHHFVGEKVIARKKFGWIHTDYSNIEVDQKRDEKMWSKMDKIVAVSDECSKTFLDVYPKLHNKTEVIENIISPKFVKEQAITGSSIGIKRKPGRTILVSVGRLTHAKGLDDAAKACRKLIDQNINVEWYIVGYGPLENELKKLIKELDLEDRFFLLGKKTNPYPYIKACDIYVQPSRYEGKAVTVREAQILEKPIVITDFPTARSQAENGVDAHITEMGVDGIVNGIKEVMQNDLLRQTLIQNLQQTNFESTAEIEKLYSLIEA
ncbi:glycosyltransferase [Metabacillus sp. GX 13764]|uniref:glycosyltransferase n=1 Tax=Metabacillus kandeliae TaxID=2900151 RepID=UPI001E45C4F4|nr:glycosyltransferase [Metabacillus kandeliae]MCD7033143.1 glycosyltransferase [Metabacillus kandeliae]